MKRFAIILFALLSAAFGGGVRAAAPAVRAELNPDTVLIGDRFSVEVLIEKDMMQVVALPSFGEGLAEGGVELVSESPLDTLEVNGRRQVLRKRYEMTSFEAGNYDFGRFPVLYGDKNVTDTLYSQAPLHVAVQTFPVDTQKSTVYDIKAPEEAPLMVGEFAGYAAAGTVLALVLAALAVLVYRRLRARRTGAAADGAPLPSVPPHVRAIQDLEALHNRKLWQSGRVKAYYTGLTDIVRCYLGGRYGINAMEMTSDEIMRATAPLPLSDKNRRDLRGILLTADLVKFAKHEPDGEENEKLYYAAYYFVEDTKELPGEAGADEKAGNDEERPR
ncbi:MAG TPA: hypothetical protein H9866_06460 [Candidatus Tidjanibacter gallistercoris]|nr:hypothetical protein [Candidatus Tidjanibacter gallistercoris]